MWLALNSAWIRSEDRLVFDLKIEEAKRHMKWIEPPMRKKSTGGPS